MNAKITSRYLQPSLAVSLVSYNEQHTTRIDEYVKPLWWENDFGRRTPLELPRSRISDVLLH